MQIDETAATEDAVVDAEVEEMVATGDAVFDGYEKKTPGCRRNLTERTGLKYICSKII